MSLEGGYIIMAADATIAINCPRCHKAPTSHQDTPVRKQMWGPKGRICYIDTWNVYGCAPCKIHWVMIDGKEEVLEDD